MSATKILVRGMMPVKRMCECGNFFTSVVKNPDKRCSSCNRKSILEHGKKSKEAEKQILKQLKGRTQ